VLTSPFCSVHETLHESLGTHDSHCVFGTMRIGDSSLDVCGASTGDASRHPETSPRTRTAACHVLDVESCPDALREERQHAWDEACAVFVIAPVA
jgi:hypothetical protein